MIFAGKTFIFGFFSLSLFTNFGVFEQIKLYFTICGRVRNLSGDRPAPNAKGGNRDTGKFSQFEGVNRVLINPLIKPFIFKVHLLLRVENEIPRNFTRLEGLIEPRELYQIFLSAPIKVENKTRRDFTRFEG